MYALYFVFFKCLERRKIKKETVKAKKQHVKRKAINGTSLNFSFYQLAYLLEHKSFQFLKCRLVFLY